MCFPTRNAVNVVSAPLVVVTRRTIGIVRNITLRRRTPVRNGLTSSILMLAVTDAIQNSQALQLSTVAMLVKLGIVLTVTMRAQMTVRYAHQ
jgi:hypothetical protein